MTARRILVAEDDDAARALVKKYLEGKGHSVAAVADGEAVLAALEAGDVDLVILDVMMPRLSGFEVLERARRRGDTTPIIMATAASSPEDIVRALNLGADDYVTKPYSFSVLMARIELRLRLRAPPPTLDVTPDASLTERLKSVADRWRKAGGPVEELKPGSVVAERYLIGQQVGAGGYGAVWRAQHIDLNQDVAIKVLHAGASSSVDAFRREAQNACRVRHPHAVRVFDFGTLPGGSAFIVMELLEGPSLEDVLMRVGRLDVKRSCTILKPVLAALAAAHKQAIIHRDVKPQNIVLHDEDGREVPKLLDFGIAKDLDSSVSDSDGMILGSPAYVAPERLRGALYDGRSDVYACGMMLYRMLTGGFPFDLALDDFEPVALWHVHAPAPPPSWKQPGLPRAVDDVVMRMMAKDPAFRPSAAEAEALIDGLLAR